MSYIREENIVGGGGRGGGKTDFGGEGAKRTLGEGQLLPPWGRNDASDFNVASNQVQEVWMEVKR